MIKPLRAFFDWFRRRPAEAAPVAVPRRHIDPLDGRIGFENDAAGAPTPDLPVSAELAALIEALVRDTGLAININSSLGGSHSPRSFHYAGQAVDINRIAGLRVDDPANADNVRRFQQAAAAHPAVAECFGPFVNIRKRGVAVEPRPDLLAMHANHLHISSQT
jgi:hypothetical protein